MTRVYCPKCDNLFDWEKASKCDKCGFNYTLHYYRSLPPFPTYKSLGLREKRENEAKDAVKNEGKTQTA